ncbi:uncharacterized protein LDX57_000217 [Aspergillus melleus]|uniref:uncharacterized protein n=1 Tax=Aspergillus melleus TaxID=138277 RepID=UPI001E8D45E0|nr:uncharacterized protein LDX57_000217 [Aspergillus melleus]KAH8422462.1 hypothetical protein LDX57_000217 [Aspergillus melleus]
MDPFEKFPCEIMLQILSYDNDFVGINSLLSVSPWVNLVFQEQPRKITLSLIRSCSITSLPEILHLLRDVVLIKSSTNHCADLESYKRLCPPPPDKIDSHHDPLPEQTTVPEMLQLIHIAANIQRLACTSLHVMQRNFVSAVERSSFPGETQPAAEPIVWIEEYRVHWALWHLQLYSIFRSTAIDRWKWSKELVNRLDNIYVTSYGWRSDAASEQTLTVAAVLADLGLSPSYGGSSSESSEEDTVKDERESDKEPVEAAWALTSKSVPFFASMALPPRSEKSPIWSPSPAPDNECKLEKIWVRAPAQRVSSSTAALMVCYYTSESILRQESPSAYLDMRQFQPFRRVGVVIWNNRRLDSVGLLPNNGRGDYYPHSIRDTIARWLALVGKPLFRPLDRRRSLSYR